MDSQRTYIFRGHKISSDIIFRTHQFPESRYIDSQMTLIFRRNRFSEDMDSSLQRTWDFQSDLWLLHLSLFSLFFLSLAILFDNGIQSTWIFRRRQLSKDLDTWFLKKNMLPVTRYTRGMVLHDHTSRIGVVRTAALSAPHCAPERHRKKPFPKTRTLSGASLSGACEPTQAPRTSKIKCHLGIACAFHYCSKSSLDQDKTVVWSKAEHENPAQRTQD